MSILHTGAPRGLRSFAALALFVFTAAEGCQIVSGLSDLEATQGPKFCEPGSVQDCYTGPEGTEGVGACVSGTQTCAPDGSAWGSCSGEVTPDPLENCAGDVDSSCNGQVACVGALLWGYLAGGTTRFVGHAVAVDSSNDVLIGGVVQGNASIQGKDIVPTGAERDGFVAKLDPEGALKWIKTFGVEGDDAVLSLTIGADDSIVIAGRFTDSIVFDPKLTLSGGGGGDIFVAKLDKDGAPIWAKGYGDAQPQSANFVTVDAEGNVVVSGWFDGVVDFGMGPHAPSVFVDGFVAKLDPNGNALWSESFSGTSSTLDEAFGVSVDSAGDVVVGGRVHGDLVFKTATYPGNMSGGAFVGKLSGASGAPMWGKVFGAPSANGTQVVIDTAATGSNGEVVIVGQFEGSIQFPPNDMITAGSGLNLFIAKLSKDGAGIWSKGLGDGGMDVATEVAVDSFGNIAVVGSFEGVLDFGLPAQPLSSVGVDGYVVKLDPEGAVLWAKGVLGPGADAAYGVAVDALGTTYITGTAGNLLSIGDNDLGMSSDVSIFFAKLTP